MKKIGDIMKNIFEGVTLIAAVLVMIRAIVSGELAFIIIGILAIVFSISLILDNHLTKKNNNVTITRWVSCITIILVCLILNM